jgi:DNA-directed RNA polymerase subunit RPC12/RpoP
MLTKSKHYCPECGSDRIGKELVGGLDMGDKICGGCRKIFSVDELISDPALQTCKACETFFPASKGYRFTGKGKDYQGDLKKGVIRCPDCKAVHHAVNVGISEGATFKLYHGAFGELLKK